MRFVHLIILVAAYFLTAQATLVWSAGEAAIASVWPASGILLAALLLTPPKRFGETLAAGAFASLIANFYAGEPVISSIGFTLANVAEVWLAFGLLKRRGIQPQQIVEGSYLPSFVAIALVAALASALVASAFTNTPSLTFLWSWFSTDALGLLLMTPFIMLAPKLWSRQGLSDNPDAPLNFFLVMLGIAGVTALTFIQSEVSLLFLPLVVLQLAVTRFGLVGASAGVLIVAIGGSLASALGYGPVAATDSSSESQALFLQFYLLSLWISSLPTAALLSSRDAAVDTLGRTVALLERAEKHAHVGHWRLSLPQGELIMSAEVYRIHGFEPGAQASISDMLQHYEKEDLLELGKRIGQAKRDAVPFEITGQMNPDGKAEKHVVTHCEVELSASGEVTALFGTLQDITLQVHLHAQKDLARAEAEELARLALIEADIDPLTGIANRRWLKRQGDSEVRKAAMSERAFSVALLDADHFKLINDSYGHQSGDLVLQRIVRSVQAVLRDGDLLARIGGEEFAILLPGASAAVALEVAERARLAVHSNDREANTPTVTISAGIAELKPEESFDSLLGRADQALYNAKASGRNRLTLAA